MSPRAGVVFATLALAACGGGDGSPPPAPLFTDPGFVDAGPWRLHYALTPTGDLPSEIAGSYGIVQKPNLALLTITAVPRAGTRAPDAARLQVEARAVSLTGRAMALALRRADAAGDVTWLATVPVRHREPFTIEIRARDADGDEFHARWTREFHLE